jgi:hypothetical protein
MAQPAHAIPQTLVDALTEHGVAIEEVAVFIDGLKATISSSMSAQDVTDLQAAIDAATARLRVLKKVEPSNPVPPPPAPAALAPRPRPH